MGGQTFSTEGNISNFIHIGGRIYIMSICTSVTIYNVQKFELMII